jgi:hypothetical protein
MIETSASSATSGTPSEAAVEYGPTKPARGAGTPCASHQGIDLIPSHQRSRLMPRSDPRHIGGTISSLQDAAKRLARGEDCSADSAPIAVDGALKDYRRDLEARNANPCNAESPPVHLTKVLLGKPAQLLNAHELNKWRDRLLGKIAPATINRVCRCRGDSNCGFARRLPRSDADTVHSYSLTGRSSARTAVILAVQPPPMVFSTETRKHSAKSSDFTSLPADGFGLPARLC